MMKMNTKMALILLAALAAMGAASISNAAIIAGWDQNSNANALAPDGFGFTPADFPQPNDHGPASASHSIFPVNPAVDANGVYTNVDSFAGTTDNDLAGAGAGGSFSFIGSSSNGSQSIFNVPTTGYSDIVVSWTQRGTSTGFMSRVFEYSSDGGANWTDVGPYTHADSTPASAGALGSAFKTVQIDLSAVAALDNNATAMFRITYDGATSTTGNNRWDNFYVEGIPEPASVLLLSVAAIGWLGFARRR